jgi:hypothetical protein
MIDRIKAPESEHGLWVITLPDSIWWTTLQAKHLIRKIKAFQGLVMPDSIAALDSWSNEPKRGSTIALRISEAALVYNDGSDRCEIEVPDALTKPLRVPSTPDRAFELHWVRAGGQSYYP